MIIKYWPEEFKVLEVPRVGHERNDCLIADIEKKNWDTTMLVKAMAKALGISQKSIGYAGLKDKTSYSVQKYSFYGVDEERLSSLTVPGVNISNIIKGDRINIGDLDGNRFEIIVRNIGMSKDVLIKKIDDNLKKFREWYGFINYFGYQRFGLQRPVTAEVGRLIVKKDYEAAALTYIGKPYPLDPMARVRKEFLEDLDFKRAYNEFPNSLRYERAMLFELAHGSGSYRECFKALPERLLKLLVHAYQSQMFNEIVKARIEEMPPNVVEIGDYIVMERYGKKAITTVNRANLDRVKKMLKDKVSVSAPLIGYRTKLPPTTIGMAARDIMDREEIAFDDFKNSDLRPFESSGTQRELLGRCHDLEYKVLDDEIYGNARCDLSFYLNKGEYATEFLRQLFNEEAIPYGLDML